MGANEASNVGDDDTVDERDDIDDLDALDGDEREAVRRVLLGLADDELVVAERYTEWQVRSPTLESDIALSNVAQDELGHARLWYDLLERFGADETDLIWERDPGTFRHSTLVERPFGEGDWADAVVRHYLYDVAEDVRLHALEESSVRPVRDRVGKVLAEEDYHLDHAHSWLERLVDHDDGRGRVQDAVDRLFPSALTLFEPVYPTGPHGDESADRAANVDDLESTVDDLGVRTESLDSMRDEWLTRVCGTLEGVGISVPDESALESAGSGDAAAAVPLGRDGAHTKHWPDLHAEMTETYRELDRDSATHIMHHE